MVILAPAGWLEKSTCCEEPWMMEAQFEKTNQNEKEKGKSKNFSQHSN